MKNKVYYGEYSLDYWIELILKKEIILPEYQRYFVWEPQQVITLFQTLKEGYFIPSVIIASCNINGKDENIIIDGQQRLTAILLAYLQRYPKKSGFQEDTIGLSTASTLRKWTFKELTKNVVSLKALKEDIRKNSKYEELPIEYKEDDFKNNYLGFSYIVPEVPDNENPLAQQNYYSTIFRSINQQGTVLEEIESRRALYFLNSKYVGWFEPQLTLKPNNKKILGKKIPFDYIRYVSVLTEYYNQHVIKGRKNFSFSDIIANMEKLTPKTYYEDYIYTVTGVGFDNKEQALERFGSFKQIFPDEEYVSTIGSIQTHLNELNFNDVPFKSLITLDIYFYGLLYYLIFQKREVNLSRKDTLLDTLAKECEKLNGDKKYVKSQNDKANWAGRIKKSIDIYMRYLKKK